MRFDADRPDRAVFERPFDVCVIGSGPAGMTLARRLAAQGLDVALMEGGGMEWTPESQDVYVGENVGHDYFDLDMARVRMFGGTSYHWNGQCRALDPGDFLARRRHPLGAWPIGKADLDPYQAEANAILDIGPALPDLPVGQPVDQSGGRSGGQSGGRSGGRSGGDPGRPPSDDFRRVQFRFSPPTRFGEKYAGEIAAAGRIFLCLHANLVDLRLDDAHHKVTGAVFKSYAAGDPGFVVRARAYALCCGGIDNARLLLNFNSQLPAGVGNGHDLVGRHFTEHPMFFLGEAIFATPPDARSQFFAPTEAFMAANETLSIMLRFNHQPPPRTTLRREIARSLQCAVPFGDRLADAVLGRIPPCDRGGLADYVRLGGEDRALWARLVTNSEQALDPANRVTLSAARDGFGMRRAVLDWRLREPDIRTIKLTTLAMARRMAEANLGRMRIYDWLLADDPVAPGMDDGNGHVGSWHHMCTTRMADDPRQGVVNRDCRVHGVENLYVGGSSVFASVGYVNPTYTVTQLALRLGDHLGRDLRA